MEIFETRSRFSFYYSHVSRRDRDYILLFSCFETRTRNWNWISHGRARKISVNSHEISREREFSLISASLHRNCIHLHQVHQVLAILWVLILKFMSARLISPSQTLQCSVCDCMKSSLERLKNLMILTMSLWSVMMIHKYILASTSQQNKMQKSESQIKQI